MERPTSDRLPTTPGVYLYKDTSGRIIYVGKARNLRKRVLSYFRPDSQLTPKTVAMLRQAVDIEILSTTTEKEALLLEASLIKKHRPHYNIVLRDDKQYVLFRISRSHPYPRLEVVRQSRRDGARYFGPFTSAQAARETWKLLHRTFLLRRCTDRAMNNRVRPCLYHHLGQCLAPCTGSVDQIQYAAQIHKVELMLSGRSRELLDALRTDMLNASEQLDFEHAAALRDQLHAVERTVERQGVVLSQALDLDVIGIVPGQGGMALGLLFVREGKLIDGQTFFWPGLGLEEGPELLFSFLTQFYGPRASVPPRIVLPWWPVSDIDTDADADTDANTAPNILPDTGLPPVPSSDICPDTSPPISPDNPADAPSSVAALEAVLSGWRTDGKADSKPDGKPDAPHRAESRHDDTVRLTLPRNPEERRLVEMAESNGREAAKKRDTPLPQRLATALDLSNPVRRIECVDVSHTGGQSTRVGMVVFEDGKSVPDAYRTYIIETGGDDTAALAAWAVRRLESGPPWPDLALIDGGKGQITAVCRALSQAGSPAIFPVAGIAKARDEHGHADRRAGNIADRIFLPNRMNPLNIREGSPELLFLQLVRDTAHRYALSRHRRARAKAALTGDLSRLPGVGPHTAKLLWDHFQNVDAMLAATPEALAALPGIGPRRAAALAARLKSLRGE